MSVSTSLIGRRCTVTDARWNAEYRERYEGKRYTIVAIARGTSADSVGWYVLVERDGVLESFAHSQIRLEAS